jgi:hypothetical protein
MAKVLSIKEPFASLIANEIKHIETRSWKTNYRGEIYIHASLTSNSLQGRDELKELVKTIDVKPSYILCKATLKDCILMDEKFIKDIKKNHQEYICGRYEIGRYAWVLTNVKKIKPIKAKGKLGIWNYDNEDL